MDTERIQNETSAKIAELNDKHRQGMMDCTVTRGIVAMGDAIHKIFSKVRGFSGFNEDNDPYGEHGFGSIVVAGIKVFCKIDYYDESLSHWRDPLSLDCQRRLTIMRADEY